MEMSFFVPLIVMFIMNFIGRLINEKSYKLLTVNKKAQLVDIFAKSRIYGSVFIVFIIVMLFVLPYFHILDTNRTLIIYIVYLFVYSILISIYSIKKLRKNDYKKEFIRLYIISSIIKFIGIAVLIGFVARTSSFL
jgi:hypothetical protein